MSTKKNNIPGKKQGKNKPNYTGFFKTRNFLLTAIMAIIIVVIVVLAVLNPFFAPPAKITSSKYYKVSQGDLLSNGSSAVFFLSWIGCITVPGGCIPAHNHDNIFYLPNRI